jgi:GT2 family glycosyltransferase
MTVSSTSVVIVAWNSADVIADCLQSVRDEIGSRGNVIVVDNASSDGTVARVLRSFPQVQVVRATGNLGFAPAVNLGLAMSSSKHVLLLNPDARLLPGSFDKLSAELDGDRVGMCGPRIVRPDGSLDAFAARRMPTPWRTMCRLLGLTRLSKWARLRDSLADRLGETSVDVPCLTGAAVLVRRDVLDHSGGLDNTIPMYLEDLELCERCRRLGQRVRYVGAASAEHIGRFSSNRSASRDVLLAMEDGHAPWLFLRRFGSRGAAGRYRAAVLIGSIARAALLVPARHLLRAGQRRRIDDASTRSIALARWALTPSSTFAARITATFDQPAEPASIEQTAPHVV